MLSTLTSRFKTGRQRRRATLSLEPSTRFWTDFYPVQCSWWSTLCNSSSRLSYAIWFIKVSLAEEIPGSRLNSLSIIANKDQYKLHVSDGAYLEEGVNAN